MAQNMIVILKMGLSGDGEVIQEINFFYLFKCLFGRFSNVLDVLNFVSMF